MNADDPRPLPAAQLDQRREHTVARLCEHYAHDHLNDQELQERIDRVYAARTVAALDALIADLPALALPGTDASHEIATVSADDVRERQIVAAIMGGAERKGAWTPARRVFAFAIMGGIVLDFRDARFAAGTTEVNIFALMGGVEVVVPPGLRIESDGIAIMGGWEHLNSEEVRGSGRGPTLRLTGLALMGGVEITTRLPGESEREAKARRRLERDDRRRLGGG
jgi:hypothetical protein